LDPNNLGACEGATWRPEDTLEGRVRDFGYYPHMAELLPGDVILFCDVHPSAPRFIHNGQKTHYRAQDSCWSHVAVYLGDGRTLCESNFALIGKSGVSTVRLDKYVGHHLIRVRRAPKITDEQRWKIALYSLTSLGEDYNLMAVVKFFFKAYTGGIEKIHRRNLYPRKARFCSQLFADAYGRSTGKLISNLTSDIITPAGLSMTMDLEDVPIRWAKID
jgi:hypothetical protein